MSSLILKATLDLLKTYPVLIPYNAHSLALHKSVNIYNIIHTPVHTYNKKFYFISSMSVTKHEEFYNDIASDIRGRDMYGDVIIYTKDIMNSLYVKNYKK